MTPTDLLVTAVFFVIAGIGWRFRLEPVADVPVPVKTKVIEPPKRRGRRGGHR